MWVLKLEILSVYVQFDFIESQRCVSCRRWRLHPFSQTFDKRKISDNMRKDYRWKTNILKAAFDFRKIVRCTVLSISAVVVAAFTSVLLGFIIANLGSTILHASIFCSCPDTVKYWHFSWLVRLHLHVYICMIYIIWDFVTDRLPIRSVLSLEVLFSACFVSECFFATLTGLWVSYSTLCRQVTKRTCISWYTYKYI